MPLTREDIIRGLTRLGRLARERGVEIELSIVGGAFQAVVVRSRKTTKDVDCVYLEPPETRIVRQLAAIVASEEGWPDDWLNDGPIGFVTERDKLKNGRVIFKKPGITARMPSVEQLLAMKLMAWRDLIDIKDARILLKMTIRKNSTWFWFFKPSRHEIWQKVEPYLLPHLGLKAKLAFAELWGELYGEEQNDD